MYRHIWIALVAVAALAGCDQLVGPGADSALSPAEVVELSDGLIQDGMTETADTTTASASADADGFAAAGVAPDVVTSSTEFSRTHACELGGETVTVGTRDRVRDTEARTGTMDVEAVRTFTDCARALTDSTTITLNGELTFTAHREWQAGSWNGPQDLTLVGSIDWATSDGRDGTCEVDVQATYDAETGERVVTGSVCGEDVSELDGWTFGTAGHGPGGGHHHSGHGSQGGPHGGHG